MPNFAQALKSEIIRISRKEIKESVQTLHRSNISLKKTVTELKNRVRLLEIENKRLTSAVKPSRLKQPALSPEAAKNVRISANNIKKLRTKLGLSQTSFAKLLEVSSQAVFAMEQKVGRLRLRSATLGNLLTIRKMGKKEVKKKLEEIEG